MKISKIHIKNYRAIENLILDLNKDINLLYGINGTGKSSIIFAINSLLYAVNSNILAKKSNTTAQNISIFPEQAIRNLNEEARIEIEFADGNGCVAIYNSKGIQGSDRSKYSSAEDTQNIFTGFDLDNTIHFKSYIPNITYETDEIKFITSNNNFGTNNINQPLFVQIAKKPEYASGRGVDYTYFKKIFEERENLENQKKICDGDQSYTDPVLEKIREGIRLIFDYFDDIQVDRAKPGHPIIVKKNKVSLDLDTQLSSGEANIIALISSIALNLYKDGADGNSIVLIDEIENSLNPQLQIKICSVLKSLFSDAQFIISSHSPFIWGGLNKDEIIWLVHDRDDENHVTRADVDYAIGGSIEDICAKFFGLHVYSNLISNEIKEIDQLIEQGKLGMAKTRLDEFRKKYGDLPLIDTFKFRMRFFE